MTQPLSPRRNAARHDWTEDEVALLRDLYPTTLTATLAERMGISVKALRYKCKQLGIKKTHEFLSELARQANHSNNGAAGRFKPGNVPFNKGIKGWDAGGRCREGQYKPGHINHNLAPIGAERVNDGYRQRKLTATGYPPRDWVCVHHIVWREAGYAIPDDHCVVFRDGDKTNIVIDNLELVSRRELMLRNSCHNHGPAIAQLVQLRGAINRKINNKERACLTT